MAEADYRTVRAATLALCEGLGPEDMVAQSMADCSPTKWHLAHTTWFFETFVLRPFLRGYEPYHPAFEALFNSYYNAVGPQFPRPRRGLVTRPDVAEVLRYRSHVDVRVMELLAGASAPEVAARVTLGIQHEQQHQELILMDIKHLLSCNPLQPAARAGAGQASGRAAPPLTFHDGPAGLVEIGHAGAGFAFDNEAPRHTVYLRPFSVASRCVTNAEMLEFIGDDGYRRPELWLSDGWAAVQAEGWTAPLYWERVDGAWTEFTLGGRRPLDPHAPVVHVSHYEADAFARWAGARLPTEAEWEAVAAARTVAGNFVESGRWHPCAAPEGSGPAQLFGDVWEWTASAYLPYPGFKAAEGALGEYNGKFMSGQMVLRGGCCASPAGHLRPEYRNFFPPRSRWQFAGLRLCKDA
jgi:ergothioneine biosynthesis protein EgtB